MPTQQSQQSEKAELFGVSRARLAAGSSMNPMSREYYGDKALAHLKSVVKNAKKGQSVKVSTTVLRKAVGIIEPAFDTVIWWLWTTGKVERVKQKARKQGCNRSGELWQLA